MWSTCMSLPSIISGFTMSWLTSSKLSWPILKSSTYSMNYMTAINSVCQCHNTAYVHTYMCRKLAHFWWVSRKNYSHLNYYMYMCSTRTLRYVYMYSLLIWNQQRKQLHVCTHMYDRIYYMYADYCVILQAADGLHVHIQHSSVGMWTNLYSPLIQWSKQHVSLHKKTNCYSTYPLWQRGMIRQRYQVT